MLFADFLGQTYVLEINDKRRQKVSEINISYEKLMTWKKPDFD